MQSITNFEPSHERSPSKIPRNDRKRLSGDDRKASVTDRNRRRHRRNHITFE